MFTTEMREITEKFFELIGKGPVTKGLTKSKLDLNDKQWNWLYRKYIYKPVIGYTDFYLDLEPRLEGTVVQKYNRALEMWYSDGNILILRDREAGEYFLADPETGDQFFNAEIVETKKAEHHATCLGTVGRRMKNQKMTPPTIPDRLLKNSGYRIVFEDAEE